MKKPVLAVSAILCVSTILFDILYMIFGGLAIKTTASVSFLLLGAVNLFYVIKTRSKPYKAPVVLFIGVMLACVADVVINISFLPGAAIFAAGHICYVICCCMLKPLSIKDLIFTFAIFIPCCMLMLFLPFVSYSGIVMQIAAIVYCFILSLASGKAVMNFIKEKNRLYLTLAIGNVLFFISDVMLFFSEFSSIMQQLFNDLCLCIYYPSECVLAFSIFLFADKKSEIS